MKLREETRAPRISGINAASQSVEVDYSTHLMNVVTFFEPVSKYSLDSVEEIRAMSDRYGALSVGFWYVMEPRLSCMLHEGIARRTLERLRLPAETLFDANNLIALQGGVQVVPTVLVVNSNSFLNSRYDGELSPIEIERNIQGRVALSGYRDELPSIQKPERSGGLLRSASVMRQMGYAGGDFIFGNMVVPETDQEFHLPDFYLLDTIYPFGAWYVSRDFIEGKSGSTLYISCGKDEGVYAFAGSDGGAVVRLHTSIESQQHPSLGKDVVNNGGMMQIDVEEFRPYEILSNSGDSDVLVSLQVISGSLALFSVEFCPEEGVLRGEHAFRSVR